MARSISSSFPPLVEEQELARQVQLAHWLSEEMGGSVPPEQADLTQVSTALDVACGAGGWVLDVARAHPHIQVLGIDTNMASIAYAQRLAQETGLSNATFLAQDMGCLEQAEERFPPESFDLVHLAFIASSLLTTDYPVLLRALFRLSRPGGTALWTEMELPITTSPALERFSALTCRALQAAGHSFIPPSLQALNALFDEWRREAGHAAFPYERRHLGITPMMRSWLRGAGYLSTQLIPTAIEVSAGTRAHPYFVRQFEVFGRQVTPFLLEQGVITEDAGEQLLSQVESEMQEDAFCGICLVLTVCARKPA